MVKGKKNQKNNILWHVKIIDNFFLCVHNFTEIQPCSFLYGFSVVVLHYDGKVKKMWQRLHGPHSLKCLPSDILQKMFAAPFRVNCLYNDK